MDSLVVNPLLTRSGRLWLQVSNYASGSTGPTVAELPPHVITSISAPAAVRTCIMRNPALRNKFFPIVTPLKWDKWHKILKAADGLNELGEVPKGLRDGFRLSSTFTVDSFYMPPNHHSALDNPTAVNNYVAKEAAGHYSKPYNPTVLGQVEQ
jgi:hypothetical protein